MTVVCGTDFSPRSIEGCFDAAAMARARGTNVVLVHAVAMPVAPGAEAGFDRIVESAREELARIAGELRRESGVEVVERVEIGSADDSIAAVAAELKASMVVISATSRPKTRWLLGSTADRIASTVAVPIFVLQDGFPVREWLAGRRTLRIAVATDLSPVSETAASWAAGLRELGPCSFVLAHVSWPPEVYRRLAIEGPMPLDRTHPLVEKVIRRELEQSARRFGDEGCEIVVESSFGRPADSLTRMARDAGADLLVVGHRVDRLWSAWEGSVARAVMRSSPVSVVCVPDSVETSAVVEPKSFSRIVAATDLSRSANVAIPYALAAAAPDARVTIVHVLDDDAGDADRVKIAADLEALARQYRAAAGVRVDVELLEGPERAQAICAFAEREDADLICLGAGGRSRLPRILFGSVAQEVLLASRQPVLVIPPAVTVAP